MVIEVCCYSLESCINAEKAGGGRIELCSGLGEGGTTPSAGLIALAKKNVSLPIYAMIRPRGGDFVYSSTEVEVMLADIGHAKSLGSDGLVMGVLTPDGEVDVDLMKRLIEAASPLGITFHRAFDVARNPEKCLETLIGLGIERVLTSGLKATAIQGVDLLRKLSKLSAGRIEIMAGGGVTSENAAELKAAGVHSLHLTGKAFRESQQSFFVEEVKMADTIPDERTIMYADPERIRPVVRVGADS